MSEKFYDTFYLENDVLTCTSIVSYKINTRTKRAGEYPSVSSTRKTKEVSQQIKKMLDEGIIRSNTSQWNAPIGSS